MSSIWCSISLLRRSRKCWRSGSSSNSRELLRAAFESHAHQKQLGRLFCFCQFFDSHQVIISSLRLPTLSRAGFTSSIFGAPCLDMVCLLLHKWASRTGRSGTGRTFVSVWQCLAVEFCKAEFNRAGFNEDMHTRALWGTPWYKQRYADTIAHVIVFT